MILIKTSIYLYSTVLLILLIGIIRCQRDYPLDIDRGRQFQTVRRYSGTIRDYSPFNAQEDANKLYRAMRGIGTEERPIINILTKRSGRQRQEIAKIYEMLYKQSLKDALKGDFSGHAEDLLVALTYSRSTYLAQLLHHAMKGIGTDLSEIAETLCSLSSEDIEKVKSAYLTKYRKDLAKAISDDTSGPVQKLLLSYVNAKNIVPRTDAQIAQDAKMLANKGFLHIEGPGGAAEIFSSRSHEDIRKIFNKFRQDTGKDALSSLNSHRTFWMTKTGKLKKVMVHLVQCISNSPEYYAKRIHDALKGPGTRDKKLIRILVSRSEIDLADIKVAYERLYGKSMKLAIDTDITGKYQEIVDGILIGNQ